MAHKGCFLQSRYPVYAYMFDIGAHPRIPINVTAAVSGTKYSDERAASNLMVTSAFCGGTWVTHVSRDLYTFLLRAGSTQRGQEGGPLPCFVLLPLALIGMPVP